MHQTGQWNPIINGEYDLTLREFRLILWMAFDGTSVDALEGIHLVNVQIFLELFSSGNETYGSIKNIANSLPEKYIRIWNAPENKTECYRWVSHAKYFDQKGYAEFQFSDELIPHLIEWKRHFTKYACKYAHKLTSAHAVRLYICLKKYVTVGEKTIDVSVLRRMLGVQEHQYKLYAEIKKSILIISQREINQQTDIQFDFVEQKRGRRITAIRFLVSRKIQRRWTKREAE